MCMIYFYLFYYYSYGLFHFYQGYTLKRCVVELIRRFKKEGCDGSIQPIQFS